MNVERIKRADHNLSAVEDITSLFIAYRQFYGRTGDEGEATSFMRRRIQSGDSIIWYLVIDDRTAGFCQVYPGHSSIQLTTEWCLNDVFVTKAARGTGGGRLLVSQVLADAVEAGAQAVWLETAPANTAARSLYESLGFIETPASDTKAFLTYRHTLGGHHA